MKTVNIFFKQRTIKLIRFGLLIFIIIFLMMSFNNNRIKPDITIPIIPKIIGMHDPENTFAKTKGITMISQYFAWNKDLGLISNYLKSVKEQNRAFLITIEPWPEPLGSSHEFRDEMLKEVISGKYDQKINSICKILSVYDLPVYVRWGHEMELTNSRYPWSNATPAIYIKAYKHFVDKCRSQGNFLKFVWSPAGEEGTKNYWPGEKYVDVIGLSVYSFDEYDRKYIGHQRSFDEVFEYKYNRIKAYNKPILIAEMGVTGTDGYKLEWLGQMKKDMEKYENIIGVVYLNAQDPQAVWESGLSNPDWKLPLRAIQILLPSQ